METSGPVVETVSRRRVISSEEVQAEGQRKTPEFWSYLEKMTPQMWASDYVLYLYREDPKPSNLGYGTNALEKCVGSIDVPGLGRVPLDSQEEVELAIRQKYGGRAFRLILKKGRERLCEGKCANDAPPKFPDTQTMQATPGAIATDSNAVAARAIDAMANQQPDAVRLAMDVLKTASEIVMKQSAPTQNPQPPTESDLDKALKAIMIQRLTADPLETFVKLKDLLQPPAKSSVQETLDLITALRNTGLVGKAGASGAWDLLAGAIPAVADAVKGAVHEWRLGMEAQERGVTMARGAATAPPANVTVLPPPQPAAAPETVPPPQPQTAPQANPGEMPMPPMQWIEQKVVEILRMQLPVDETVDALLDWLYITDERLVPLLLDPPKLDQRLSPGEKGLLELFQHQPILQQIPMNPRLVEFIKKFVLAAKAAEVERLAQKRGAAEPAPNAATLLEPEKPA